MSIRHGRSLALAVMLALGACTWGPEPTTSGGMWPQSSLDEVREAQRLADAGDLRYTWQVEPELAAHLDDAEIFARFLWEELGWEEFRGGVYRGSLRHPGGEVFDDIVFVRCAPGQTNPLYPNDDLGGGCAPTIDEFRYETVQIGVAQLGRRDHPSGIWVVTRWVVLQSSSQLHTIDNQVQQVVPPSDAEVADLMEVFLQARVDGEGAQEYLSEQTLQARVDGEGGTLWEAVPVLYSTTTGASYERFEVERVEGPVWPEGWLEMKVRLFAEGGQTVVEQFFFLDRHPDGRFVLEYQDDRTTENGTAVPEPYGILDGEVTFHAVGSTWAVYLPRPDSAFLFHVSDSALLMVLADPLPTEPACAEGRGPVSAEALAQIVRSNPDLEATVPVAVSVGGIDALRLDVSAARGATVCPSVLVRDSAGGFGGQGGIPVVSRPQGAALDRGQRMRLYLVDLPEGSARTLAIAIVGPEADFERVVEAAAPIVDSFEFRTR